MTTNLFTIAATDQSVFYLGQIFGQIGGVLPVPSGPMLLGIMFKVVNTAALSVGALIVVYTTVAGLLSTASEGEFLGKKWSGMWVPIRTVLGIIGLFPSSGGYCAIQIVIMWLILQGVGFADMLWTSVLNLITATGSVYTQTSFPVLSQTVQPNFKNLFTGMVCYDSLGRTEGVGSIPAPYLCSNSTQASNPRCTGAQYIDPTTRSTDPSVFTPEQQTYDLGDSCGGKLQFCNPSPTAPNSPCADAKSLNCMLCKAQRQALSEIIPTLGSIAATFVQMDYDYQKFYYTSSSQTTSAEVPQWIQNFCSQNNIQNQCCVGLPDLAKSPTVLGSGYAQSSYLNSPQFKKCSYFTFVSKYPPSTTGNNQGPGTVNPNVLKEIYLPQIQSLTNDIDFIKAASDQYQATMNAAYQSFIVALPPSVIREGWNRDAQSNGWILAGMYYMQISQNASGLLPSSKVLPVLTFNTVPNPIATNSDIAPYRNDINAMGDLFQNLNSADASGNSDIATSALAGITGTSTTALHSMLSSFMGNITGKPGELVKNPLYNISLWGYNMMITVQLVFALTVVLTTAFAAATATNFIVIGTGMTSPPWYEAFKAAWGFLSPFLILGMSGLFSIGAILGIYLPLIPYTIYLMGAVGWLMATIEAMVAGPIIALGILSPSGQHELLGKAEPAILIIFNLILRPALMVFGMMASMLVAVVVVTMINQGFAKVAFNIIQAPGLVEGIFFMIAYTSLLVMAMNKVFSLIHVIPEKVLTYIGGQAISYGESEGMQAMKQTMEGGASGISGSGKEAGAAPAAGVTKQAQDQAHEDAESRGQGVKATRKDRKTTGKNT